jgi:DNA-binding response OmpR family regulator
MPEEKNLLAEVASGSYDAADRPFDFLEANVPTALICEADEAVGKKIGEMFKVLGYQLTEPQTARDALKSMRFHVYDVVVINENFDAACPEGNNVLQYLRSLAMHTRRQIFVVLISSRFRTLDNIAAFNNSVNITYNPQNINDIGTIIKGALDDNAHFYQVFRETLKKTGHA